MGRQKKKKKTYRALLNPAWGGRGVGGEKQKGGEHPDKNWEKKKKKMNTQNLKLTQPEGEALGATKRGRQSGGGTGGEGGRGVWLTQGCATRGTEGGIGTGKKKKETGPQIPKKGFWKQVKKNLGKWKKSTASQKKCFWRDRNASCARGPREKRCSHGKSGTQKMTRFHFKKKGPKEQRKNASRMTGALKTRKTKGEPKKLNSETEEKS